MDHLSATNQPWPPFPVAAGCGRRLFDGLKRLARACLCSLTECSFRRCEFVDSASHHTLLGRCRIAICLSRGLGVSSRGRTQAACVHEEFPLDLQIGSGQPISSGHGVCAWECRCNGNNA